MSYFFYKKSEKCNFADNNTLFCGDKNLDLVFFFNPSSGPSNVMDWFKIIHLKLSRESSNL